MKYLHYNLMILVLLLAKIGYSQTILSDQNYVHTTTPQQPVTIEQLDQVGGANEPAEKRHIEEVTYFDGLGRPMQSVGIKQSPNSKDIITHIEYDALGRQARQHLPFERDVFTGVYRPVDVNGQINAYYLNKYPEDFSGVTDLNQVNAYSENVYEASPLNRVTQQAAPGGAWKAGNGHEIKFEYDLNNANEVHLFEVVFASGDTEQPSITGGIAFYEKRQLYKTITYNENHTTGKDHSTEEFKNSEGQVVLKRTYDQNIAHDTYYVYDKYGNLTYVLPPKVDLSNGLSQVELDELGYQYKYDYRNRLIEKKIPGKEWEAIVYNTLDQPILTQDTLLKQDNQWLFTKYDALGRVVYTGKITILNKTRKQIQTEATAFTGDKVVSRANPSTIGGVTMYYDNGGYPNTQNAEVLTINYYDDYAFLGATPNAKLANPTTVYGEAITSKTKTLTTGGKIKVLDTDTWITAVTYYDQKSRPIYAASKNDYLNTIDVVTTQLDFNGKIKETTTRHTKDSHAEITTVDKFSYDHTGRLLTQTQTINDSNSELIVANSYDQLGQLAHKKVGGIATGNGLQTVDYEYNIRGWLKSINNGTTDNGDLFGFKINYNTPQHGATPLFNGNISETTWQTANDHINRHYTYGYDALNRIKEAISNSGRYNLSGVTYDKNGNILSLDRTGAIVAHIDPTQNSHFGLMDQLTYNYDIGNKLQSVTDGATTSFGFKKVNSAIAGTNYTYDANGNMLTDTNKGITNITYNHLNLPSTVAIANTEKTGNINYIYDATGTKLKKIVTEGGSLTTEYAGNYVYKNNKLEYFSTPEGYVEPNNSNGFDYIYQYTDHLGNVRLSYTDVDNNGTIEQSEVIEEKNYYPFGLTHKGYNVNVSSLGNSTAQKIGYNGKELNEELGLNWIDYGARNYQPDLGRWFGIDDLAEGYYDYSPYNYAINNPTFFIDPDGNMLQFFGSKEALEEFRTLISTSTNGQVSANIDDDGFVTFSQTGDEISDKNQAFLDAVNPIVENEATTQVAIFGSKDESSRHNNFVGGFRSVTLDSKDANGNIVSQKKIGAIDVADIDFINKESKGKVSTQALTAHELVENYNEQVVNKGDGKFDPAHNAGKDAQGKIDGITNVKNTPNLSPSRTNSGQESLSGSLTFKGRTNGGKPFRVKVFIKNNNPTEVKIKK